MVQTKNESETEDATSSTVIDRVYRDIVDVRRAIVLQLEHSTAGPSVAGTQQADVEASTAVAELTQLGRGGPGRRVRRALRRLIIPFYRAAKPFARPIAGKMRRSLLEQWQLEVRAAIVNLRETAERIERNEWAIQSTLDHKVQENVQALHSLQHSMVVSQQAFQQQLQDLQLMLESTRGLVNQIYPRLDTIESETSVAARRIAMYCGKGEALILTPSGYVVCETADQSLLACLLDSGELERGTRLLIQRLLEPGDVFVDVGANIGLHTLAAAKAMSGAGRIIAFEPFEPTAHLLEKSIFINGFSGIVAIHQAAVSDHAGQHTLFLGKTSGHHSLFPLAESARSASTTIDVPLVTLDSVMAPDFHADLIKVDVEGAELEVLSGAKLTIEHNPQIALIAEMGPSHLARRGHSLVDWLRAFQRLGLDYQVIDAETGTLERWNIEQLERVESVNLFFARPGAAAWEKVRAE